MHTCTENKQTGFLGPPQGWKKGVLASFKAVIPESSSALSPECFINDLVLPRLHQPVIILWEEKYCSWLILSYS